MAVVNLGNLVRDGEYFLGDHTKQIGTEAQKTIFETSGYIDLRADASSLSVSLGYTSRIVVSSDLQTTSALIDGVGKRGINIAFDLLGVGQPGFFRPGLQGDGFLIKSTPIEADLEAGGASLAGTAKKRLHAGGDIFAGYGAGSIPAEVELSFQYYGRWAETAGASVVWTPVTSQVA